MKHSPLSLLAAVLVTLGGWTASLHGAVLVSYTFSSGNGNPTLSGEDFSALAAAWAGFPSGTGGSGFSSGTQSAYVSSQSLSDSFEADEYLTLTLQADPGKLLDLASITIEFGGSVVSTSTTTQNNALQVRTSLDGFGSSLAFSPGSSTEALLSVPSIEGVSNTQYDFFTIDLSGLAPAETITFHLHVYSPPPRSGSNFLRIGSVVLDGQIVAIPESSSVAFAAIGALTLFGFARRFRCARRS